MLVTVLRVLTLSLGLCACSTQRRCPPERFETQRLWPPVSVHFLAQAPLVLVGTITGSAPLCPPRPALSLPAITIQCVSVSIAVENVLKGSFSGPTARVLSYVLIRSRERMVAAPPFTPEVGARRIFFLEVVGGDLRVWRDVRDYTLPVSGGPQSEDSLRGMTFEERVAAVMLTCHSGSMAYNFAGYLDLGAYVSDILTSQSNTDHLLNAIERDVSDQRVHADVVGLLEARIRGRNDLDRAGIPIDRRRDDPSY
jgi:hypothetical protein